MPGTLREMPNKHAQWACNAFARNKSTYDVAQSDRNRKLTSALYIIVRRI